MLHIEIQSIGFWLMFAPFGYWDVRDDKREAPVLAMRFGAWKWRRGGAVVQA